MKKVFLSLMAVATMCGTATAQTLAVANVEALPGETVSFALVIDVQGGSYSGFQFQMQFPTEGFSTSGTTISPDWDGGSLGVGDLVAGAANGSASSMSDTPIPDGEREIGTVKFTVGNGVAVGDYDVTISGFNFLDGTNYTPVADVTFKVNVVNAHSVVLNENSTTAPEASSGAVNVRVKRTINANEWSTICLPFAMTKAQVKTAFGDDVELGDFTGCNVDDETGNITVNFSDAAAIEANHPYIIKVSMAVTEFTADGVDIAPEDEPALDRDEVTTGSGRNKKTTYNSFIGNYTAETVVPDYGLFLNANKFWFSTGNTKMKAFRAYFDLATAGAEYNLDASRISMAFNESAGIKGIGNAELRMENSVYDLQGRRVNNSQLKKGLYIKEGKKVIQ